MFGLDCVCVQEAVCLYLTVCVGGCVLDCEFACVCVCVEGCVYLYFILCM